VAQGFEAMVLLRLGAVEGIQDEYRDRPVDADDQQQGCRERRESLLSFMALRAAYSDPGTRTGGDTPFHARSRQIGPATAAQTRQRLAAAPPGGARTLFSLSRSSTQ
jgi:hypothetical protein